MKLLANHEVEFDHEAGMSRVRFVGRVTLDNLLTFVDELYNDPDYNPAWDALIDMGAAVFDLSFTDFMHYADRVGKDPRRVQGTTVIVTRSLLHFGIGRMFDSSAAGRLGAVHFERSVEAARERLARIRSHETSV